MGWFSWSKKQDEPSSPTRENRKICWETRDAYFTCLDRAGVVKPGDETSPTCRGEKKAYEGNCAKSWIDYFNQRRVIADAQRARLAQEANPSEQSSNSKR